MTWDGGRSWIRTSEGVSQQIYSLPPLATWVSYRNCANEAARNISEAAAPVNGVAPFTLRKGEMKNRPRRRSRRREKAELDLLQDSASSRRRLRFFNP